LRIIKPDIESVNKKSKFKVVILEEPFFLITHGGEGSGRELLFCPLTPSRDAASLPYGN
jgi:hypothetical protein